MRYVLVVDHLVSTIPTALQKLGAEMGEEFGVLFLTRYPANYLQVNMHGMPLEVHACDFEDDDAMSRLIEPYRDRIAAVACRGDKQVQFLRRLIPHLPDSVPVSSAESLQAATNKRLMREWFGQSYPEITPSYVRVYGPGAESVAAVEAAMGYPVIVKPASLVSSLLIQKCQDAEQLAAALDGVFEAIDRIYQREDRKDAAEVIVEEYLSGDFYSVDCYVREDDMYFCPPVAYIPAQALGIDDFFLYKRFVPTALTPEQTEACFEATRKAVRALGLTFSAAHVELILTQSGWKIIEVGPRLGRFRHSMYKLGYGIDHSYNDLAVHLDRPAVVADTLVAACTAYSIYPDQEGTLEWIEGIDRLRHDPAVHGLKILAAPGERVYFAKNGGKALAEFIISTPDKAHFDELTAYVESTVKASISIEK